MTPTVDLTEETNRLRHLAADCQELRRCVLAVIPLAPGPEALRQLAPLVLASQELVGKTILRLSALSTSPYTAVRGSRASLDALGAAVAGASLVSCDLAHALAANPLEGIGYDGPQEDEAGIRRARHADAAPDMADHLAQATRQLQLCETAFLYLANAIPRDLDRSAPRNADQAPHKLSATQYEALRTLAKGGATMETRGRGQTIVITPDHSRITIATFQSLDKRSLVRLDTSVPLHQGRAITVTAEGHRALARHQARTGTATVAAAAPSAATAAKSAHR
ncbi:hypothetical protein [Streptomyces antibioticus]|uniref:hypothetical protein n=1 Tax=Streptomyces antibioticus TaxID=1890 RepID=UPI0036F5A54E